MTENVNPYLFSWALCRAALVRAVYTPVRKITMAADVAPCHRFWEGAKPSTLIAHALVEHPLLSTSKN